MHQTSFKLWNIYTFSTILACVNLSGANLNAQHRGNCIIDKPPILYNRTSRDINLCLLSSPLFLAPLYFSCPRLRFTAPYRCYQNEKGHRKINLTPFFFFFSFALIMWCDVGNRWPFFPAVHTHTFRVQQIGYRAQIRLQLATPAELVTWSEVTCVYLLADIKISSVRYIKVRLNIIIIITLSPEIVFISSCRGPLLSDTPSSDLCEQKHSHYIYSLSNPPLQSCL